MNRSADTVWIHVQPDRDTTRRIVHGNMGRMRATVVLLLFAFLLPVALAEPSVPHPDGGYAAEASDEFGVERFIAAHAQWGRFSLPTLSADEVDALGRGEPILIMAGDSRLAGNDDVGKLGIFGMQVIAAPRLLLWLTLLGGASDGSVDKRYVGVMLERPAPGVYAKYQHVDLPWPFRDRHWVIHAQKNLGLAGGSQDATWEHFWSLHEHGPDMMWSAHEDGVIPGLSVKRLQKSIYLPANRGAWILHELDNELTLVAAYFEADLGGTFPAALVRSFTKRQFRSGLAKVAELAAGVHEVYDGDPAVFDGRGRPITSAEVTAVAEQWRGERRLVMQDH